MKKWKMYIPAIIIIFFCTALIAYEFYISPTIGPGGHGPRPGGGLPPKGQQFEKSSLRGIFNWFGTIAIIGGAITYSWVSFKKKLKSSSPFIKKFSKLLFRVHNVIGYTTGDPLLGLLQEHWRYGAFSSLLRGLLYKSNLQRRKLFEYFTSGRRYTAWTADFTHAEKKGRVPRRLG